MSKKKNHRYKLIVLTPNLEIFHLYRGCYFRVLFELFLNNAGNMTYL